MVTCCRREREREREKRKKKGRDKDEIRLDVCMDGCEVRYGTIQSGTERNETRSVTSKIHPKDKTYTQRRKINLFQQSTKHTHMYICIYMYIYISNDVELTVGTLGIIIVQHVIYK